MNKIDSLIAQFVKKAEQSWMINEALNKHYNKHYLHNDDFDHIDDNSLVEAISKKLPNNKDIRFQRGVNTATGALMGGAVGGMLTNGGSLKKLLLGIGAGGVAGGAGLYGIDKLMSRKYEGYDEDTKKRILLEAIQKKKKFNQSSAGKATKEYEKFDSYHSLAGAISGVGLAAAGLPLPAILGRMKEMDDTTLDELQTNTNLKGKLLVKKPTEAKGPYFQENAYFSDSPKDPKKNIIGGVSATSKRMWRPGIMAHELGHADIARGKGLTSFLQNKVYKPTMVANAYGGGMLTSGLAYGATKNDEDPLKAGLKGAGIGAAMNAGILVPEFEASRRGIANLMKTKLPMRQKLTNSASLLPAFLTYALSTAGVSGGVGALHAHNNKKNRLAKEKRERKAARNA